MTTFRDLPVGTVFEFDHSGLPAASGIARGPWIKTSARKYAHVDRPDQQHRVGTITVKVIRKGR